MYLDFINFILESHPSIDPKTGKRYRSNKQIEEVRRIANNSPVPRSRIWITYSDVPKLGIKPEVNKSKSTPVGVFAYPVDYYLDKNGDMPYANDRKYLIIFEAKGILLEVGYDEVESKKELFLKYSKPHWKSSLKPLVLSALNSMENKFNELTSNYSNFRIQIDNYFTIWDWNTKNELLFVLEDLLLGFLKNIRDKIASFVYRDEKTSYYVFDTFNDEDFILSNEFVIQKNIKYLKNKIISFNEILSVLDEKTKRQIEERLKINDAYWGILSKTNCDKFVHEILNVIKNKLNEVKEFNYEEIQIPMKQELNQICLKNNLDLKDIIKEFVNQSRIKYRTKSSVLYSLAKFIAFKLSNGSWYHVKWNQILRELGFSGVIDTKNTGMVHPSELTQGAFLDVRQLKIIDILLNDNKTKFYDIKNDATYDEKKFKLMENKLIKAFYSMSSKGVNKYNLISLINLLTHIKKSFNSSLIWGAKMLEERKHFIKYLNSAKSGFKDAEIANLIDLLLKELESDNVVNSGKIIN